MAKYKFKKPGEKAAPKGGMKQAAPSPKALKRYAAKAVQKGA